MKRSFLAGFIGGLVGVVLYAQTPAPQLRVVTDATGALVATLEAQTLPLSQPTAFNQIRLRTDASNSLVITGITIPPSFSASDPHDWTATQYFSRVCFGTEAAFDGCLENDTENSPPAGDTTRLANSTTRQTFRVYGSETNDPTTAFFLEFRAPTSAGAAGQFNVKRGDQLGSHPLAFNAESYLTFANFTDVMIGIFPGTEITTRGLQIRSNGQFQFSSGAVDAVTTSDVGFARDAAGEVRVTDGAGGFGTIDADAYKVDNTAGDTDTCAAGVTAITVVSGIVTSITCT